MTTKKINLNANSKLVGIITVTLALKSNQTQ